ncbi:ComEC/Rec2 family competence protein [Bdellovibrio bacteriovorus]|uniref:Metallo-beta-lactamase domain-containing protein n=1 Tax=Bdellovibrio bacteriovorus TaxID=959 RepID=A0A1Z3N6D0_BDEBC|nr:hypothetical protein [Bdellovibrio bacteriovorus]ASD63023.1 hypothetical protein B9G79_05290 [Bdellovibrio bacteriovorus]
MKVYSLNVAQGNFTVVVGTNEAFIVDTHVPMGTDQKVINIKGALADILKNKALIGLMITGFDADHFNSVGLSIILHKYLPNWIMYPKYFKATDNASECFKLIDAHDTNSKIQRVPILLNDNKSRFYSKLSKEFTFEIFSPHAEDKSSSNNCSLVCKVVENSSQQSYLVTGDTEIDRWANIIKEFGNSLASQMMTAPHHGSKNGSSKELLSAVSPYKIIVSAGVNNQYGHPHKEAVELFNQHSKIWYQTNTGSDGQSILTTLEAGKDPISTKYSI